MHIADMATSHILGILLLAALKNAMELYMSYPLGVQVGAWVTRSKNYWGLMQQSILSAKTGALTLTTKKDEGVMVEKMHNLFTSCGQNATTADT